MTVVGGSLVRAPCSGYLSNILYSGVNSSFYANV